MALPEAGVQLVAEGLSSFTADMGRANDAVADFGKSGGSAGSAFDKGFSEIVIGGLRKVGELGVEALLKAGQAIGAFVGDSINLAGDFEASMLEFQSVAGKEVDTAGLEKFRDLFIDIGKRLPVSTSDVQQAAIEMVKGGIDPATIAAGGLEQNIQFAAAAMGGDLVKAAEISSKIMGGWAGVGATAAEKAEFLTHATDLMARAANASSTDVEGLSLGIFNAQGIARTAGVEFDDLTTSLAALAPRFESSSVAGNSLKNMIARLQPTTDKAAAYMLDLGLITEEGGNKFFDAQGKFVGFQQVAELLKTSLQGLTQQQQAMYLQQIFGNDAMGAAAGLAELGAAGYQEMADALANANGVADAAALKQQGLNTAMDNAKGSVEALQITIGSALSPVLENLLNNYVSPGINALTDFASAVFGSDEAFNRLLPDMQIAVTVIDALVTDIQGVISAFDDAGAMSSEFGESIGNLASDLGLPGELIQDIVFAVQDLVGVFSDGSAAADDLGGAVDDLSGVWQKAQQVVDNVMGAYQDIAQSVLPIVTQFVDEHGEEIAAFFKTAYDQIIRIVNLALDLYNAIVPSVLGDVADWIDDHATGIQAVLSGAWDVITGLVSAALQLIEGTFRIALDVINGDWEQAWTDLQTMSAGFVESLTTVITGFLNIIAGFFNTNLDEIGRLWQTNWDMLVDIAMGIADQMVEAGASIIEGIIQGLRSNAGGVLDFLIQLAKDAVAAFFDAIDGGSPAMEFAPAGASIVEGLILGMSDMWPAMMKLVDKLGAEVIDKAMGIGEAVQGAVADAFGATASIDRQIAKNLDSLGKNVLPDYQSFATGALKAAENEARRFLDPKEGAEYFKMRSNQILEYEKLRKELAEAETSDDQKRIKQQMLLINAAQQAEISAFNASLNAGQSATEQLAADIQELLATKVKVKDPKTGKETEVGLPGILDSQIIATITGLLNQIQSYSPYSSYTNPVTPPMTAQQRQYSGQTSYSRTTNLNMPIYTNNTPDALQQSMAIAQAAMP